MPRKWFTRLLLSYLPIFCIVITVLIVISFLFIYQLSKSEAIKANRIYAEHVMQTIEHSLRLTDQMVMKEIQGEASFSFDAFFNESPGREQPWVNYQTNLKLRQLEKALPVFSTIYLYRQSDQSILNPLYGQSDMDSFWDKAFIEQIIDSGEAPRNWSPIRSIFADNHTPYVTTLVRKVPLLTGSQGIVVVNVHTDSLQSMIAKITDSNLTYIHLLDQNANDIFFVGNASTEMAKEEKTELSNISSSYTGWSILSGFQVKQWFNIFSLFSYVWFSVALFSIILGVVWIILMSHRNNKPIKSILKSIHTYSEKKNQSFFRNPSRDELGYIESAIHNLLQESSEIEKQNKENIAYRQRLLFQEWLEGQRLVSLMEWSEGGQEFKPDFQVRQVALMLVEIDHYEQLADQYHEKDRLLLKHIVKQVLKEMVDPEETLTIWSEWMSDKRMATIFLSSDDVTPVWHRLSEQYLDWINENLNFTVTISWGSDKQEMDDIPDSYNEAKQALSHKITFGMKRIIHHEDIAKLKPVDTTTYIPIIEGLILNFRQGDPSWQTKLTQLFQLFKTDYISIPLLTNLLSYFNYQIQQQMNELSYDYVEVWNSEGSLLSEIEAHQSEQLDDIFQQVLEWLQHKEIQLKQIRDKNTHRESMIEMKKYIEAHYHNTELSLNFLSGLFHIQPTYLSRMFKDELGEKFVDYLVKVRIHHAKILLSETNETIQQITDRVGYSHVVSFTRAFKKVTGIPPGEYRKAVNKAKE